MGIFRKNHYLRITIILLRYKRNMDPRLSAAIDWQRLIALGFQLIAEFRKDAYDWTAILAIIAEAIQTLIQAEQQAQIAIDWEKLLQLIISLLPLLFQQKPVV